MSNDWLLSRHLKCDKIQQKKKLVNVIANINLHLMLNLSVNSFYLFFSFKWNTFRHFKKFISCCCFHSFNFFGVFVWNSTRFTTLCHTIKSGSFVFSGELKLQQRKIILKQKMPHQNLKRRNKILFRSHFCCFFSLLSIWYCRLTKKTLQI